MNGELNCQSVLMRVCVSGWKKNWQRQSRTNPLCRCAPRFARAQVHCSKLFRVVVDDAEGVARAAPHAANAVAKRYAIVPFRAADGAIARCENDAVTLTGGDDFGPGLRARHIFNEDKLAAFPIAALLAEH